MVGVGGGCGSVVVVVGVGAAGVVDVVVGGVGGAVAIVVAAAVVCLDRLTRWSPSQRDMRECRVCFVLSCLSACMYFCLEVLPV